MSNKINIDMVPEYSSSFLYGYSEKIDDGLLSTAKNNSSYGAGTKYNEMFCDLFFCGGKIEARVGVSIDEEIRVLRYFRFVMASSSIKHEDKAAVCALLLSLICD